MMFGSRNHPLSCRILIVMMRLKHISTKYIAIVTLFISILLGLRWIWSEVIFPPTERLIAVNGVIDLRGREFNNTSTFALNGEWEFYPGQLLSHQNLQTGKHTADHVQVPGNWGKNISEGANLSFGYGTYRLRILFDPLEQPVAFWLRGIQASSAVQLNGVAESAFGKPAVDERDYKPRSLSYTASYSEIGTREIELIIQVANFDDPYNGGIVQPIRFGSQAAIDFTRWYSIGFQMVTFITLMLHALYIFIFYLFNPRERTLALVFLLTMAVATATIAGYDNLLLVWLPINYTWALKIKLLSQLWQPLLVLLAFRGLTQYKLNTVWWLRIYTSLLAVYTASLLIAPATFAHGSVELGIFGLFYILPFLRFIYAIILIILKDTNDNGRFLLLLSATGIILNMLWASWNSYKDTSLVYYPLDMIAAIIGFAAYWFREFFLKSAENAKLYEKLKREDKLKDQFLANTSHELRTPLHGIMNIAETVLTKEEQKLDQTSLKNMNLLITISRRMSHMLDDLLDVARLHEHRIILQKEPLRIQTIVPGIFEMLRYMIEDKPIRLDMNIDESLPAVTADEKRLVQVLYNLLHNAIKYTGEGNISVSAEAKYGRVLIHVSDTGVGMDKETQRRIFLPYEQGAYGKSDGRGIGLGLSICQQLITLHGGTLSARSENGKGSVFSFDLPLASSSDTPESHSSSYQDTAIRFKEDYAEMVLPDTSAGEWAATGMSPGLLDGETVHILAVDDDPINLNVLAGILSTEPYSITKALSAQEALNLLGTRQWDLVIADVMMPHMSGYELTQRIRVNYSVSELPILLLTARSQPADIYTGFLSGANDYMTKPVDAMELRYRIKALTTLKRSINERLRMEAAYLQAQIHPHFLFNTLNSIMALSEVDSEKMIKLGDAFASFLRISFDFLNTGELVPISHELQLVEAHLYIEKERFGDRLTIVWEVEENIHLLLPPLSIQPLVENAVRHGLLRRLKGGTVRIRIVQQKSGTLIEVSDDGNGMDQDKIDQLLNPVMQGKSGIGVTNTHRRLIQLYGKGLSISSKPGEGTTVSFIIPNHRNH